MEGQYRPDHFRGVATVVLKLFNIIPASHAYFGQKDFQQAAMISAMVRELDVPIQVDVLPIVREPDGLAMSSRNRYLSPDQRRRALAISRALKRARTLVAEGVCQADRIEQAMRMEMEQGGVDSIDYAQVACPETLQPVARVTERAIALIAARVGETRLIDNMWLAVATTNSLSTLD